MIHRVQGILSASEKIVNDVQAHRNHSIVNIFLTIHVVQKILDAHLS